MQPNPAHPLGDLSARAFLRRHWQKRPLLVRAALPDFVDAVSRGDLFALAGRDDVESRLVLRSNDRWRVRHGPFDKRELARLPPAGWSLLVQGVNHFLPRADAMLGCFAFIPYARFDDVMVSVSPPGGGVGPHVDAYDVFLLQTSGRRRWRISRQRDLALIEDAPLRLLRDFRATREWLLEPGDMLYLPPGRAHDGVAVTDHCITCSIGFRAAGARELATGFLDYLRDNLRIAGAYTDPELRLQAHPAAIGRSMTRKLHALLARLRWSASDEATFFGVFLTEPKPNVTFEPPQPPAGEERFRSDAESRGVALAPKSRMLYRGNAMFINGEHHRVGAGARRVLAGLADRRRIEPAQRLDAESLELLYQWYRAGYIVPNTGAGGGGHDGPGRRRTGAEPAKARRRRGV